MRICINELDEDLKIKRGGYMFGGAARHVTYSVTMEQQE
jgi:hypothetical protein